MSKNNNQIPFGLKEGRLVGVDEVVSGRACGCVCPACHRVLQANKSRKITSYFSHDPSEGNTACESAFETSIHLMAKQILSEDGFSIFPTQKVSVSAEDSYGESHVEVMTLEDEGVRSFDVVELEKRLENIRPDIIAYIDGLPFLIEVAVTSFCNNAKIKTIRDLGLPALEIDLSKVSYATREEELRALINGSSSKKKWISNPRAIEAKKELRERLKEKIRSIDEERKRKRTDSDLRFKPYRPQRSSSQVQSSLEFGGSSPLHHKQYKKRWFLCEACRHLFQVPTTEVPYSLDTTPCPECDHDVIAMPTY